MKDRVAQRPNVYKATPVAGGDPYELTIVRADDPLEEGTPFNVATMLRDATALLYGLQPDAVPDDVLAVIGEALGRLGAFAANAAVPVNRGGTGATTAQEARTNLGLGTADTVQFGRVLGAVYQ